MRAGRLNTFLTPQRLAVTVNADTGETLRRWETLPDIRAERVKFNARAVAKRGEVTIDADAVFYIRINHPVEDGWRVRERGGELYDCVVEPNREKGLKLLKCKKVNA